MAKTLEQINKKIEKGEAVVVTAEEVIDLVDKKGEEQVAREVDVVTTATFGAMCSSGAFINFGHSDPPIKAKKVLLNDVPAYAGLAAVDIYIGATETSETKGMEYGGAHVIEDLIAGKKVKLKASAEPTDCYPREHYETYITKDNINQAYLFNPRNCYQNYNAAANTSSETIYTYMGMLLPNTGNVTYSTSGELSPLFNDPYLRTIGIGTRVFLGGAQGYISWEGTQHNPNQERGENGVPLGPGATLAVIGNLKDMQARFISAGVVNKYGVTLYVGLGIPIPVLDVEVVKRAAVRNSEIYTSVLDYSVQRREKPVIKQVSYETLRQGEVEIEGKRVPTQPLSSLFKAREIAHELSDLIRKGDFLLTKPVQHLPGTGGRA